MIVDSHLVTIRPDFAGLLMKYAILLTVLLLFEFVIRMFIQLYIFEILPDFSRSFSIYSSMGVAYLSNLVTLAFLYRDMRKSRTINWPVRIMALFYNEIAVCFFLLLVLFKKQITGEEAGSGN